MDTLQLKGVEVVIPPKESNFNGAKKAVFIEDSEGNQTQIIENGAKHQ